ncbi:MAG: WYL domain-containing protein [Nanoarchaeota archaeon]|nr:WYL domain-containing protein [Nanoarchaeota archaeon]MBU4284282.1 WYL domain-containing protein [Nanoarchaeota archaeon]MBU4456579.1 WYL domain-containing protein [Nanoarchaeota archaeon]
MSVSLTLSKKEVVQVHQILKAFDEGLIVNPSENLELDYYDEKIVDRNGLKLIIKKIEKSLPKEESEKTKKKVLRRRYDTFNNEINESAYRKIENAFNNQKTVEIGYFDMASAEIRKREIDVYPKTRKYVIGYCHLRKAIRKFRTSRIVTAKLIDKDYTIPSNFDRYKY